MKESLLHLIWQQELFCQQNLCTTKKQNLEIHKKGFLNRLQGPDFSNGLIEVAGQKWAGNIEIHVKSSDWYAHKHEKDENYQKIILHVVYEHDVEVFDVCGNEIPTLELQQYVDKEVLKRYENLVKRDKKWIFCEHTLKDIDAFKLKSWLERVYVERLERKLTEIENVFKKTNNNWEATLFLMLAKCFGGNINGPIFLMAFSQIDFSVLRKQITNKRLEPVLYGLTGLLNQEQIEDGYLDLLRSEFNYQKTKHNLKDLPLVKLNFYGCRPNNFPTIRLAQFISFYEKEQNVFSKVIALKSNIEDYKKLFEGRVNDYWQTHYNFDRDSKKSPRYISDSFRNLVMINAIIPVLFAYLKHKGEDSSYLLDLMYSIDAEKNNIVQKFEKLGCKTHSALETQALLTLKKEYCDKARCTDCALGVDLITQLTHQTS